MMFDDEFESLQNQRTLALNTIDELTVIKLQLLEAQKDIPQFINNAIAHLKKKYLTEERTLSYSLLKKDTAANQ